MGMASPFRIPASQALTYVQLAFLGALPKLHSPLALPA